MSRNILFIMCDQLRWDYLSCYGNLQLHTPNIDLLAQHGVRFANAYCQAPLCGPSRASFYTGRYLSSHGVMANPDTTRIDEMTLGDYLRPLGYRTALVGKADNRKDPAMLRAYGVAADSDYARAAACGGFEPYAHHEGLYPDPILPEDLAYNNYLVSQGYRGGNPWHEYANCGVAADGTLRSGWRLRNSHYPSRVAAEHSETAWATSRAIDFLETQEGDRPWCLHRGRNGLGHARAVGFVPERRLKRGQVEGGGRRVGRDLDLHDGAGVGAVAGQDGRCADRVQIRCARVVVVAGNPGREGGGSPTRWRSCRRAR